MKLVKCLVMACVAMCCTAPLAVAQNSHKNMRSAEARAERMSKRLHLEGDKEARFQEIYADYLKSMDNLMRQSRYEDQAERYAQMADSLQLSVSSTIRQSLKTIEKATEAQDEAMQKAQDELAQWRQRQNSEPAFTEQEKQQLLESVKKVQEAANSDEVKSAIKQLQEACEKARKELQDNWQSKNLSGLMRPMRGGKGGRMPQARDGKQPSVADSVRILMRQWKPAPTDKNFSTKIQNQFRRGQNILNLRLSCYLALSQVLDPAEIMRLYEFERVDSEQLRREQWRRQEKAPQKGAPVRRQERNRSK